MFIRLSSTQKSKNALLSLIYAVLNQVKGMIHFGFSLADFRDITARQKLEHLRVNASELISV